MTARQQTFGRKVWRSAKLNDSLSDQIRVSLLFISVLQKLGRDSFGIDSGSHKIMALITQHADDLGRQRFVQKFDHRVAIRAIALGHGAVFNMFSRAFAQRFYVSQKWFVSHDVTPLSFWFFQREVKILLAVGKQSKAAVSRAVSGFVSCVPADYIRTI